MSRVTSLGGRQGRNYGTGVVQLKPNQGDGGLPRGGNANDYLDELERRLVGEGEQQQAAADRQFNRKQGVIDDLAGFLKSVPQSVIDSADLGAERLDSLGKELGSKADAFTSGVNDRLDRLLGQVDKDVNSVFAGADRIEGGVDRAVTGAVNRANTRADAAVAASQSAIDNYEQDQSRLIQANVAAIDKRAKNALKMASAGVRPDGTRMSAAEKQAMLREVTVATAQESAAVTAQIQSQANETMANLRNTLAQVNLGAGEVALAGGRLKVEGEQVKAAANQQRLGAAGLRAEAGTAIEQTRVQAEQTALAYRRMEADLSQVSTQIKTAARLDAANLRLQGMGLLADMIERNPETIVSLYTGLAAIFGARIQESGSDVGTLLASPAQSFGDLFHQLKAPNTGAPLSAGFNPQRYSPDSKAPGKEPAQPVYNALPPGVYGPPAPAGL